jgi:hypothetical protein
MDVRKHSVEFGSGSRENAATSGHTTVSCCMLIAASAFRHFGTTFRNLRFTDETARLFRPSSKWLRTRCRLTALRIRTSNLYTHSLACKRTEGIDDGSFDGVNETLRVIASIAVALVRD